MTPEGVKVNEYQESNRLLWNEWADIHAKSAFYDVEGFKAGRISLDAIETEGVGDVRDKSLLHLQCHFGQTTLSWARLGAQVTGADFSERAIALARSLAEELGIPATFVQSDVDHLPDALSGEFDVVFTSYGVLGWLYDLKRWGQVIAHFLKPGGTFFIAEYHPFANVFDNGDVQRLEVIYPYFFHEKPLRFDVQGSYADPAAHVEHAVEYGWSHSLSEIMMVLIEAGLRIEAFHEYPFSNMPSLPPLMEQSEDGWWRFKEHQESVPLMFSIRATKPKRD
jgi:SAM-dependent methyltransferase